MRFAILTLLALGVSPPASAFATDNTDPHAASRANMVEHQLKARGIKDPRVLHVFRSLERHRFVEKEQLAHAYDDRPLPIGYGQTISQPFMVAYMTEAAKPGKNMVALEVGTGSGYQAAALAKLVKHVHTIEIVRPLFERAKNRLRAMGFDNVTVHSGDGYYGIKDAGPFDIILVTAAAKNIPPPLKAQLKVGGRMIIPVGEQAWVQSLYIVEQKSPKNFTIEDVMPVAFVPLTGTH